MNSARKIVTPSKVVASVDELTALGTLLDEVEAAHVRLYLTPSGDLRYQASQGAMTQARRRVLTMYKGALLRALRMAGALGEAPVAPTSKGACLDPAHVASSDGPHYSYTLGRWICRVCDPDVYAVFVLAVARAYHARTAATHIGLALADGDAPATGPQPAGTLRQVDGDISRAERAARIDTLRPWALAHEWPRLAICWGTGAGTYRAPFMWVGEGAAGWGAFLDGASSADLLAAYQAAGLVTADAEEAPPVTCTQDSHQDMLAAFTHQCIRCGVSIDIAGNPLDDADPTPLCYDCAERLATAQGPQNSLRETSPKQERDETGEAETADSEGEPSDYDTILALDDSGLYCLYPDMAGAMGAIQRLGNTPDPTTTPDVHVLLDLAVQHRAGQVWVHPKWARLAGLPMDTISARKRDKPIHHPFVAGPWHTNETPTTSWGSKQGDRLISWMRFYRPGTHGTIAISMPHADDRLTGYSTFRAELTGDAPILARAADARELLAAVGELRAALHGITYRSGPGATSNAILRAVHARGSNALDLAAALAPADYPEPAKQPNLVPSGLSWMRPETDSERAGMDAGLLRSAHGWDKAAMVLAASASLKLGLGAPRHLSGAGITVDAKRPGYWLARVDGDKPYPDLPSATYPIRDAADSPHWYATPTLVLASEWGATIAINEAWVWDQVHEPLEAWYQRLRDARATLRQRSRAPGEEGAPAQLALGMLKSIYTQGFGWLDLSYMREYDTLAPGTDLYRPDWRHAVWATANANLLRNFASVYKTTGRAPFAILTDCGYYLSAAAVATDDEPAGLNRSGAHEHPDRLGIFAPKESGLAVADFAPAFDAACTKLPHRAARVFQMLRHGHGGMPEDGSQGEGE